MPKKSMQPILDVPVGSSKPDLVEETEPGITVDIAVNWGTCRYEVTEMPSKFGGTWDRFDYYADICIEDQDFPDSWIPSWIFEKFYKFHRRQIPKKVYSYSFLRQEYEKNDTTYNQVTVTDLETD